MTQQFSHSMFILVPWCQASWCTNYFYHEGWWVWSSCASSLKSVWCRVRNSDTAATKNISAGNAVIVWCEKTLGWKQALQLHSGSVVKGWISITLAAESIFFPNESKILSCLYRQSEKSRGTFFFQAGKLSCFLSRITPRLQKIYKENIIFSRMH